MKISYWQRINILNEHFGISMSELERRAGLSPNSLPRKEPENYCPRTTTVEKLCKVYGIQFKYFFMEEFDFAEIDFDVQRNKILEMFNQLPEREQKLMLHILQERDPVKFYQKCYEFISTLDKDKYSSFEDYMEKINAKIKDYKSKNK